VLPEQIRNWMVHHDYCADEDHCASKYDKTEENGNVKKERSGHAEDGRTEEKYVKHVSTKATYEALVKPSKSNALDKKIRATLKKRKETPLAELSVKESFKGFSGVDMARVFSGRIICGNESTNIVRIGNKYLFEKHVLKGGEDDIRVEFLIEGEVINVYFKRKHVRGVSSHPELMLLPAQGGSIVPLGKAMKYKMKANEEYVGPVTLVHCTPKHTKVTSSGTMAASGYTALTEPGWCVSPVFSTTGTTEWIGVHYLSKEKTNSCIRFTKEIIKELSCNDFNSRPKASLGTPSVEC